MINFESLDKFAELIRAIVLSFSLSIALFVISFGMISSNRKKISLKSGFIILLMCTGILIFGVIHVISSILNTSWLNNDFPNWAAVVIEIGVAIFISGMIFLYDREHNRKTKELEDSRLLSEYQHYKERLLSELHRLLDLINVNASMNEGENQSMNHNNMHAEKCIERLRTINIAFRSPSETRSHFDEILSQYETLLEGAHCGVTRISSYKTLNKEYATNVKKFLNDQFFQKNNTDTIQKSLDTVNEFLLKITV